MLRSPVKVLPATTPNAIPYAIVVSIAIIVTDMLARHAKGVYVEVIDKVARQAITGRAYRLTARVGKQVIEPGETAKNATETAADLIQHEVRQASQGIRRAIRSPKLFAP